MSNTPPNENHASTDEQAGKASAKFLIAPVIIAVFALIGGILLQDKLSQPLTSDQLKNTTLYPADFRPVPAFELQDQNGQSFSQTQLQGKWSVIFFGFTNCPDVCPSTLNILQQAYERLGEHQKDVQVILVSVDPQRDSQQQRKDYIEYFHPDFLAIGEEDGGQGDKIKALTKSMYIHYETVANKESPADYLVDHSAAILIINPAGRRHAQITQPILPGAIAQDIAAMIEAY